MQYTEKLKLAVVKDYLSGSGGQREVAQRHGVEPTSLRNWVAAYREHGPAGIAARITRPRYTAEFKLAVLMRIKKDGLSRRRASAIFGIRKFDVIAEWQRLYDEGGPSAFAASGQARRAPMLPPDKPPPKLRHNQTRSQEDLLEEIRRLQMENAYLKKLDALVQSRTRSVRRKKR